MTTRKSNDRTLNMLGALSFALMRKLRAAMTDAGAVADSDQATLHLLLQYPATTVGVLADILELSPSSTVRVVDRLERRKLLRREPSPEDARQVTLRLSAAGQRLAEQVMAARLGALSPCLAQLPESDRVELDRLLEALLTGLTDSRLMADRICALCDERRCPPNRCPVECKAVSLG